MKQIDKNKIGPTIARGGDCIVKKYGKTQVIKISTLSKILGKGHTKKLVGDYKACQKYFGDFITPTTYSNYNGRHIELQEYIIGEKLCKKHFQNKKIHAQFHNIVLGIDSMKIVGLAPIDLIGFHGALKLCFDNIIVDEKMNLHIIDVALLESGSLGFKGYIFSPFMILARCVQYLMISYMFKKPF